MSKPWIRFDWLRPFSWIKEGEHQYAFLLFGRTPWFMGTRPAPEGSGYAVESYVIKYRYHIGLNLFLVNIKASFTL